MILRATATTLLLLALTACTHVEPPEVLITSLTPLESTLLEQRVRVGLRFQNPNDFDLAVNGLQVSVDVNDARFLRAVDGSSLTIPRLGEAELTVDASTTVLELVVGLLRARDDQVLRYRVSGRLHLLEPTARKLAFESEGELSPLLEPLRPSDELRPRSPGLDTVGVPDSR